MLDPQQASSQLQLLYSPRSRSTDEYSADTESSCPGRCGCLEMSTLKVNSEPTETSRILFTLYVTPLLNPLPKLFAACILTEQIGFLTEWQMYAQKIEGDSWMGEKLDSGKIDKMSG